MYILLVDDDDVLMVDVEGLGGAVGSYWPIHVELPGRALNWGNVVPGPWDIYYADMSITSLDGTVTQIFASNPPNALTRNGNGNYATSDENFMVNGETVGVGGLMAQGAIHFFLNDHLGSSALEFAAGGWPVASSQFTPFGGEINPQPTGTPVTDNHYKFTGFESDSESGLDHAVNRQYSAIAGRWLSTDPDEGSMDANNPQSLNRYNYVSNMPLSITDPSGLDGEASGGTGCIAAAAGGGPGAEVGCAIFIAIDALIISQFLPNHPKFHQSTSSRPIWDEHGSYKPTASIAGILGIDNAGCEFGACGSSFGPGGGGSSTMTMAGGTFIDLSPLVLKLASDIHFPYADVSDPNYRLFGTHYCGPGGGGGTTGGLDSLCAAHDACYRKSGVSAIDNLNPFTSGAAMGGCDRLLCASLSQYSPTSRAESVGKGQVQQVFGCGYINK